MKSTLNLISYLIENAERALAKGHTKKALGFLAEAKKSTTREGKTPDHYYIAAVQG